MLLNHVCSLKTKEEMLFERKYFAYNYQCAIYLPHPLVWQDNLFLEEHSLVFNVGLFNKALKKIKNREWLLLLKNIIWFAHDNIWPKDFVYLDKIYDYIKLSEDEEFRTYLKEFLKLFSVTKGCVILDISSAPSTAPVSLEMAQKNELVLKYKQD